jgi:hypothetical protein
MPNTKVYESACATGANICLDHLERPEIIEYMYGLCDAYAELRKLYANNVEYKQQYTEKWTAIMSIGDHLNFSRDFKVIFEEVLTDMIVDKDTVEVKITQKSIGVVHHQIFT